MIDLHYNATGLGEIDCDCCGNVLGFGFVDHADDCGFLCSACKIKLEHEEAPELERQHFEMICRNLDYMFCDGHDWKDITHCCMVFGATVFRCKKCGADKTEPLNMNFAELTMIDVPELKMDVPESTYTPWTKD